MRLLEIACFNEAAVQAAIDAGAQRIELCTDYKAGGLTPEPLMIKRVIENTEIPVHVIIRPRAGNFSYNREEFDKMKRSVGVCRELKANGIVFGMLGADNRIDKRACLEMKELAGDMSLTFHRAVDFCPDMFEAFGTLIELGIGRVLTSGGAPSAMEGIETIAALQKRFGKKITVMPGGGIRSSNIRQMLTSTGCAEYHSAAITSGSEMPDEAEIKKINDILNED